MILKYKHALKIDPSICWMHIATLPRRHVSSRLCRSVSLPPPLRLLPFSPSPSQPLLLTSLRLSFMVLILAVVIWSLLKSKTSSLSSLRICMLFSQSTSFVCKTTATQQQCDTTSQHAGRYRYVYTFVACYTWYTAGAPKQQLYIDSSIHFCPTNVNIFLLGWEDRGLRFTKPKLKLSSFSIC